MTKFRMFKVVLVFALMPFLPAQAADTRILEANEVSEFAAMGRLALNRRQEDPNFGCSGTLVAADVVLTAAHCLTYAFNGEPSKVRQLVFQAGHFDGASVATATAARFAFHPDYERGKKKARRMIPNDLALIFLATPIEGIEPIELGTLADTFQLLNFVVYQAGAPYVPRFSSGCSHSFQSLRVLEVGCAVVGGNSGGGVIAGEGDDRRLVAVLAAASGGRGLAVLPDDWLRAELANHLSTN